MAKNKWLIGLFTLLLIVISFFKDDFTPDYRNTSAASFLNPDNLTEPRLATLYTHAWFWIKSIVYSTCFIVLPILIIKHSFEHIGLTKFTTLLLISLMVILYVAIFINLRSIDVILVSKLNRYLHSPILTMFLWATFTIGAKRN
jgi:hypothetical protein